MELDPLRSVLPSPSLPQPGSVTAELAQARTKLRETAPPGRWDAVMAEVTRLQVDQAMSPLAAMRAVQAKLASGWQPRA
jgi:hypothetical protein